MKHWNDWSIQNYGWEHNPKEKSDTVSGAALLACVSCKEKLQSFCVPFYLLLCYTQISKKLSAHYLSITSALLFLSLELSCVWVLH